MFWIEYQVIDYRGNHVGNKEISLKKNDFLILGAFLTKVNKLKERTEEAIQELMLNDKDFLNLIRNDYYDQFDSYTEEEIQDLDEKIKNAIKDNRYSDEYYQFIYSYLDIAPETTMGDNNYYLGESSFFERHKGKDYEWTF